MPSASVISAVFIIVGTAMIVTAIVKARGLDLSAESRSQLALCGNLAAIGLSFVVQSPLLRALQNNIVNNLGQLLGNGTTLSASFAALVMVLYIAHPAEVANRKVWPRLAAFVVALGAMTVLFVLNPGDASEFTTGSSIPAGIFVYYLVFLTYLAAALVDLFMLVRYHAGQTRDRELRSGLTLVSAGCLVGLIYVLGRAAFLMLADTGGEAMLGHRLFSAAEFAIGVIIPSVAALLVAAGVSFTHWAPYLLQPVRWLGFRRSHRRLAPLWEAVRDARPGLVLELDRSVPTRLRLYRRIIEIQDARLMISGYLDPGTQRAAVQAADAAGLTGDDADTVAEAAIFAAGLRVLGEHRGPLAGAVDGHSVQPPADEDLAAIARRLEHISLAYARSPVVKSFAATSTAISS